MLLGALGATSLGNLLKTKGIIRAGEDTIRAGNDTISRAGFLIPLHPLTKV